MFSFHIQRPRSLSIYSGINFSGQDPIRVSVWTRDRLAHRPQTISYYSIHSSTRFNIGLTPSLYKHPSISRRTTWKDWSHSHSIDINWYESVFPDLFRRVIIVKTKIFIYHSFKNIIFLDIIDDVSLTSRDVSIWKHCYNYYWKTIDIFSK